MSNGRYLKVARVYLTIREMLEHVRWGLLARGRQGDGDRFGRRGVALLRHASDRNENVGLGIVGRRAASGYRVRRHHKLLCLARLPVEMAGEIDELALNEPRRGDILLVEED